MSRHSRKRRYRAQRRAAGYAQQASEAAQRRAEEQIGLLGGYRTRGEELAGTMGEQLGEFAQYRPGLAQYLKGTTIDPYMGATRLSDMLRTWTATGKPEAGIDAVAPWARPYQKGVSIRGVAAPTAAEEFWHMPVSGEEMGQIAPIATKQQQWLNLQTPIEKAQIRGTRESELAEQKAKEAQAYWAAYARNKRKYQESTAKMKKLAALGVGGLGTLLSFGALGPVLGAAGLGGTTAFGAGGVGSILGGAGLGAVSGGITGGPKGALLGGVLGALPGVGSRLGIGEMLRGAVGAGAKGALSPAVTAATKGVGMGLRGLGGAAAQATPFSLTNFLSQAATSPWLQTGLGGATDWFNFQRKQLPAWRQMLRQREQEMFR